MLLFLNWSLTKFLSNLLLLYKMVQAAWYCFDFGFLVSRVSVHTHVNKFPPILVFNSHLASAYLFYLILNKWLVFSESWTAENIGYNCFGVYLIAQWVYHVDVPIINEAMNMFVTCPIRHQGNTPGPIYIQLMYFSCLSSFSSVICHCL